MERSPAETAYLVDSHYSRSFGRPPDAEMREFIRNAAEHGLTADELINCMTAAVVTYGFGAYERDYRKFLYVAAQMQDSAARGDLCYIKNRSAMVRSIRCVYIL